MIDYTIVTGSDTRIRTAQSDLMNLVRDAMAQGWRPMGGVVYLGTEANHGFTCHLFCQTMVMPPGARQEESGK